MNIHDRMKERYELAQVYAKDGAFFEASRVLLQLALDVRCHAIINSPGLSAIPDAVFLHGPQVIVERQTDTRQQELAGHPFKASFDDKGVSMMFGRTKTHGALSGRLRTKTHGALSGRLRTVPPEDRTHVAKHVPIDPLKHQQARESPEAVRAALAKLPKRRKPIGTGDK